MFPIVWSRRSGNSSVRTPFFDSSGTVITPAANAPTATKLVCPKERTPELPTKTWIATTIATLTSAFRK